MAHNDCLHKRKTIIPGLKRRHHPLPHFPSLFLPPLYLPASSAKTTEVNKAKVLPLWSFHFVGALSLFLSWKPDFCHRTLAFESRRGILLLLRGVLAPWRSVIPVEIWPLKWMVQNFQAAVRTKLWGKEVKLVIQLSRSTSGALHLSVRLSVLVAWIGCHRPKGYVTVSY